MKPTGLVALIGGAASVAASILPGDAGQAWGPFVTLCSIVLLLAAWTAAADHTPTTGEASAHKRAA